MMASRYGASPPHYPYAPLHHPFSEGSSGTPSPESLLFIFLPDLLRAGLRAVLEAACLHQHHRQHLVIATNQPRPFNWASLLDLHSVSKNAVYLDAVARRVQGDCRTSGRSGGFSHFVINTDVIVLSTPEDRGPSGT